MFTMYNYSQPYSLDSHISFQSQSLTIKTGQQVNSTSQTRGGGVLDFSLGGGGRRGPSCPDPV